MLIEWLQCFHGRNNPHNASNVLFFLTSVGEIIEKSAQPGFFEEKE